jgi:tRNA pseudouridine55 synthase
MAPDSGDAAVLLCDKPAGVTSHDVVDRVRRRRGGKVGHAGTLDPFATGLLLLLLGRATRLQRYLVALPKTYIVTARLGWRSSSGDPDGELVQTGRVPGTLRLPQGRIRQRVPMTSAVKIGGERLYRKARRGERIETPEREVEVYRAELLGSDRARAEFEIECSSGTYVRTLIETLEDAYCETLRRVAIGPFRVEAAGEEPLSVEAAMSFLPEQPLDDTMAAAVSHGRRVPTAGLSAEPGATVRLTHDQRLLAIGRVGAEEIKPEVVLA